MQSTRPLQTSVEIDDITGLKEQTALQRLLGSQPFWVLDGAAADLRGDVLAAAARLRHHGQLLQHHPQLRLCRHHGAWA